RAVAPQVVEVLAALGGVAPRQLGQPLGRDGGGGVAGHLQQAAEVERETGDRGLGDLARLPLGAVSHTGGCYRCLFTCSQGAWSRLPTTGRAGQNPGGGTNPPRSRSRWPATATAVRSSREGARTRTPTGSPPGVRPMGGTATGSSSAPMPPAQFRLSVYGRSTPSASPVRGRMSPRGL